MSSTLVLSILLAISFAVTFESSDAYADSDKPRPPISIIQARRIALARMPGTIVNEKLKTKKNKPPTWSIKIRPRGVAETSDQLIKIEVDATTAAILKVKEVKARKREDE